MKAALLKKLLILPLLFIAGTLIAQPPPAIPIQSVAKDALGNPAKNRKVFLKVQLIQKSLTGNVVWEEAFETTTNEDGIYTVIIGMGKKEPRISIPDISKIDWANGPFFSSWKIAVAPSIPAAWWLPADNYVDLGTQQMMSVPYALFAGNASVTNVNTSITPGPRNTFLITDTAGNVMWAPPQAANVSVTNVTNFNLNLAIRTGQNVNIQPNTTSIVEVEVAGVSLGDPILITAQGDYENWSVYSAWVESPGKVRIRFANYTDAPVDVQGSQYKIVVIK